jgi:hypothetical protein
MRATFRTLLIPVLCLSLAACPSMVRQPPERDLSLPPIAPVDLSGATVYAVNPLVSQLHVLVYRGGTLARFGHNHVMSSRSVSGRIWVHPQTQRSGFELSLPVNDLIVDDPDARRAAGAEFPPDIPPADKDGTRKNMLRTEVLDAQTYPQITLRSASIAGVLPQIGVTTRITIKDVSRDIEVPTVVTISGTRLSATGEFDIRQTEFGIKPFSIGLGALEVQDRLRIKFTVVADRKEEG